MGRNPRVALTLLLHNLVQEVLHLPTRLLLASADDGAYAAGQGDELERIALSSSLTGGLDRSIPDLSWLQSE